MVNIEKFLIEAKRQTYANDSAERIANTNQKREMRKIKNEKNPSTSIN